MGQVHVVAYDPQWPLLFETLRARIWPAVHDLVQGLEHVGSTSVPGLVAKPVIDMDIIIADDAPMQPVVERLRAIGYAHRGDLGIVGREAFRAPAEHPAHHLYVCRESTLPLANHLAVRDHLRAHPETVARYGALKLELAREFRYDMDSYVAGKTGLLLEILRQVGFSAEKLNMIERANRAS